MSDVSRRVKKVEKKSKPMPTRWQQIIDLLPQHDWQITPAAFAVNYSPKYIESRLLGVLRRDGRFCSAVEAKKAALARKHNIQTDRLIREWLRIGFSNIEDFVTCDDEGKFQFISFDKIERAKLAAVESIKVTTNTTQNKSGDQEYITKNIQFKLYSKLQALEQLGKIVGVFEKDNRQKQGRTIVEILAIVANDRNRRRNLDS